MKAIEFFMSDVRRKPKVTTKEDCGRCDLNLCCGFYNLFKDFLSLEAVLWDEKGCPRDGFDVQITEKIDPATMPGVSPSD